MNTLGISGHIKFFLKKSGLQVIAVFLNVM